MFVILNIGKTQAKKQEEIKSFVDEDVLEQEITIPEYTLTGERKRKKAVKHLIRELKEYYGTDDNTLCDYAQYYKGYYYFIENNSIYRTKENEDEKERIHTTDEGCLELEELKS